MIKHSISTLICIFSLYIASASADDDATSATSTPAAYNSPKVCPAKLKRPCVALVLGGGGARGSAHIGVLQAIEEYNIPIDLIVGTSIGSFVGALYATGNTAEKIAKLVTENNWNLGYTDLMTRDNIPIRRKQQIVNFPIQVGLGFDGKSIKLPKGIIQGQGMNALILNILGIYPEFDSFDNLPIPYRAVAADVTTGKEFVMDSGNLAAATQISMSLPGILRPTEFKGHLLIDGGIANNLPISVARQLGADIVIAVNIQSPKADKSELNSGFSILNQLTGFLTRQNVQRQISELKPGDILIEPRLETITLASFDKMAEGIPIGYEAAKTLLSQSPQLLALGAKTEKPKIEQLRHYRLDDYIYIDKIILTNKTRLHDDYLLHKMQLSAGKTYTVNEIRNNINRLYAQGTIAKILDSIRNENNQNILYITVEEKEWGPGYLDFKISFEDDFNSFSQYQIGTSYRLTNLSEYGAEWYTTVEFGTDKIITSELYWPIKTSDYFLIASGSYERDRTEYRQEERSAGAIVDTYGELNAGIGWNGLNHLEVTLRAAYIDGETKLPYPVFADTGIDHVSVSRYGGELGLKYDSLDDPNFPTKGWKFNLDLDRTQDNVFSLTQFSTRLDTELNGVTSIKRHSFRGQIRWQSHLTDRDFELIDLFSLGGFLNLSGNPRDAFIGQHVRFFSGIYTYKLKNNDFGALTLPLYLGASLEAGNAWQRTSEIHYGDLLYSSSLFIGWDSPVGPAYLAYGKSETGDQSFYVFLGVTF